MISAKNAFFSQGTTQRDQDRLLKSFRPELLEALKTAGRRLPPLSALCTQIFETDVLFASLPNRGTIAALEIELNALLARNPPPERRDQINEALSQLRQTSEDLNEIERIQGGEITSEDIVRFNSALQENLFFSATLGATLENIGEAAGGIALEMLPTKLNPAALVSTVLSNAATGAVLSHAALSKLLPMIPAHIRENRTPSRSRCNDGSINPCLLLLFGPLCRRFWIL